VVKEYNEEQIKNTPIAEGILDNLLRIPLENLEERIRLLKKEIKARRSIKKKILAQTGSQDCTRRAEKRKGENKVDIRMKEVKDLIRKLKPVMGRKADALWYSYLWDKKDRKNSDIDVLRILADKKVRFNYDPDIVLPPCEKSKIEGEYYLGDIYYAGRFYCKFGLREDEFIKHILIIGMTGTGKTNTAYQLLTQLRLKNKPFLIFDWKKNYRDLIQIPLFRNLKIHTVGSDTNPFYFNPLIPPPGTDPKYWLTRLVNVIEHAYFVGHGVEYFLRKAIDVMYKKCGIYKGSTSYPTFRDIDLVIKKEYARGREMLWLASAKRVLSSLTFSGSLGDVLNTNRKFPVDDLLKRNVVLEMDCLSDSDKIFFTEALLLWIFEYRKNEGKREKFKHAIVIEEAHHVLSHKKELEKGEETIIETLLRMIREFGESVIVIDQEPTKLSDSIKANTYCKITFNLGTGKDSIEIGRCMNLSNEQLSFIDKLKVGQTIIKLKGRCHKPLLCFFPLVGIKKGAITDEMVTYSSKNHIEESG
jgi:hypothetical protein